MHPTTTTVLRFRFSLGYSILLGRFKDWSYLDKHLVSNWGLGGLCRGAIDGHGLPVTGELKGKFLLHKLFDHLGKRGKMYINMKFCLEGA